MSTNGTSAAAHLRVHLFGAFQLSASDAPDQPLAITSRKEQHLLALLTLNAPNRLPRDFLAFSLWPESGEEQARANLRQTLRRLRVALTTGGEEDRGLVDFRSSGLVEPAAPVQPRPLRFRDPIGADRNSIWLLLDAVSIDVVEFKNLVRQAREAERHDLAQATALYQQAVDLYKGDLLDYYHDDWCVQEREALRHSFRDVVERLINHYAARGNFSAAIITAQRLLIRDKVQESVHRDLMRLHFLAGDKGSALEQYRIFRELLRREFGTEPLEQTTTLYRSILNSSANTATAAIM